MDNTFTRLKGICNIGKNREASNKTKKNTPKKSLLSRNRKLSAKNEMFWNDYKTSDLTPPRLPTFRKRLQKLSSSKPSSPHKGKKHSKPSKPHKGKKHSKPSKPSKSKKSGGLNKWLGGIKKTKKQTKAKKGGLSLSAQLSKLKNSIHRIKKKDHKPLKVTLGKKHKKSHHKRSHKSQKLKLGKKNKKPKKLNQKAHKQTKKISQKTHNEKRGVKLNKKDLDKPTKTDDSLSCENPEIKTAPEEFTLNDKTKKIQSKLFGNMMTVCKLISRKNFLRKNNSLKNSVTKKKIKNMKRTIKDDKIDLNNLNSKLRRELQKRYNDQNDKITDSNSSLRNWYLCSRKTIIKKYKSLLKVQKALRIETMKTAKSARATLPKYLKEMNKLRSHWEDYKKNYRRRKSAELYTFVKNLIKKYKLGA